METVAEVQLTKPNVGLISARSYHSLLSTTQFSNHTSKVAGVISQLCALSCFVVGRDTCACFTPDMEHLRGGKV